MSEEVKVVSIPLEDPFDVPENIIIDLNLQFTLKQMLSLSVGEKINIIESMVEIMLEKNNRQHEQVLFRIFFTAISTKYVINKLLKNSSSI